MILRIGACHIDCDRRRIVRDGEERHVSRKGFDLLLALLDERPKVVSKNDLIARVWPDTFVSDANLAVLVGDLRAALGDPPRKPLIVRTHHRVGYSFIGVVSEIISPDRTPAILPAFVMLAGTRRLLLHPGTLTVGRDQDCDVVLPHHSVSRLHARLIVSPDTLVVEDVGSKNGTRLDDARVTTALPATDGQRLTFGSIETTVHIAHASDGSTITAPEPE